VGNFGSGKWSNILTRKTSVEQCRVLSMKQLRLGGLFGAGSVTVDWRDVAGRVVNFFLTKNILTRKFLVANN